MLSGFELYPRWVPLLKAGDTYLLNEGTNIEDNITI